MCIRDSSLSGSAVTYASGGIGGNHLTNPSSPADGASNKGIGGGATGGATNNRGGNGGSGLVILKFADSKTASVGAGLTTSSSTAGGYTTLTCTAGAGTVTFS